MVGLPLFSRPLTILNRDYRVSFWPILAYAIFLNYTSFTIILFCLYHQGAENRNGLCCRFPHLSSSDLFFFGHFDQQAVVLQLQRPDAVDIDSQPIVEVLQILLLLQARNAGRRERCRSHGTASFTAWGCSRHVVQN